MKSRHVLRILMRKRQTNTTGCKQSRHMRGCYKRITQVFAFCFVFATAGQGSFYTVDRLFTWRPDETDLLTEIERFGPVGLRIELHQPAFVMKIGNVEEGSPAYKTGMLKEGQIIETVNGEALRDIDPRIQLGNIITQAEATDGRIELVVRDDEDAAPETVVLQIPVLGSYSDTWPLDCAKSDRIVRGLADWTATQGPRIRYDGGLRMLFLLSTGEDQDLEVVREWIAEFAEDDGDRLINNNWHTGYSGIAVAEYYLRTGDETAIPLLETLVRSAEHNYMPGGWSTRGQGNFRYGRISSAGLHVTTFLLLAAECGVEVDPHIKEGALRQFIRYVGRGNVPYGDHRPENGYTDNGKNGALAFTMAAAKAVSRAGEESAYARARDASAIRGFYSTHWMLHGHTGGGLGEIWRGAAMGLMHDKDTPRYRSFMDQRKWFYEMSRRHDGSFGIVGGRRYDNTEWGVGMGLSFTIPRRTLRISGAPPTEHSQQVSLPAQIWGTEADHDFYSLEPARSSIGSAPDVDSERVGRGYWIPAILDRIADGDADVIQKYIQHPDFEVRRRAAERLNLVGEDVVLEALRSEDARLRDVGVIGLENHGSLRTDATMDVLLEMISNPEESWWVVQRALQVVDNHLDDIDRLKARTDRLLHWAEHDDWWLSGSAVPLVMRLAAHEHETERILQTVGQWMAANRHPGQWHHRHLINEFENAPQEVRQQLLAMLSGVYDDWPGEQYAPVRPQVEGQVIGRVAQVVATLEGGLERLYQLSQQRYPDRTLAHRDLFLNNQDQLADSPEVLSRVMDLTREELIPEFVVEHAYDLMVRLDTNPTSGRMRFRLNRAEGHMKELVSLYQRAGIDDYNWHDYGPERTEMEWWYHTFDPVEQPPLGEERHRLGRYREVTYPEGMEDWNQPDFDAAGAGWERGLAPFAHRNGEKRAVANRCNRHEGRGMDFCGCGEPPNTFWENEVLLKAGAFDIPPFEEGYAYRILYGGSSHVHFGDGTHIYVNGEQIFRRDRAVDRGQGARPMGARVTTERWEDFASGRVHLAAKSFLKYRGNNYGNSLTVFMRRMKLPPFQDELQKGLQLVGLRDAAWQELQDPDSDTDPEQDLYIWDGEESRSAEAIGSWKVVGQVEAIRDFDPDSLQQPSGGWNPQGIDLTDDLSTSDPLLVWTGPMLLDANRKEALAVEHAQVDGKDYLFIQAGGFDAEHPVDWTSPWLVFERD